MNTINVKQLKVKFVRYIYIIALFAVFIIPCDARKSYSSYLHPLGVGVIIICSLATGFLLSQKKLILRREILQFAVIYLFLLLSFIPAIIGGNISYDIILRHLLMFIFYFIIVENGSMSIVELAIAAVLINAYLAYRCFFQVGINTFVYYQGTNINSNQFAMTLMGGILGACYLFLISKNKLWKWISLLLLGISLVFVALSSSRTIALLCVLAILLFLIFYLHNEFGIFIFKNRKLKKKHFLILSVILVAILYMIFSNYEMLLNFFLHKWGVFNILSGRDDIWKNILQNATWIGNADSSLNSNGEFFNWLLRYGILPFIMFIIFMIYILIHSIKNYRQYPNVNNYFILVTTIIYVGIELFENVFTFFGKPINIIFLCLVGFSFRSMKNSTELEK